MSSVEDKLTLDRNAMRDRSTAHLRIYVGGVTDKTTVEDIYEHFIKFGQINGIVVNKNFGFVQFETEQSAQDAISKADGSVLNGKQLTVRTAQTNTDNKRSNEKREVEVVHVVPEVPPAVALSDNIPVVNDNDLSHDDMYDSYGNYIGDKAPHPKTGYSGEDEFEESFAEFGGRGRGRGGRRGRGRNGPGGFDEPPPTGGRGGGGGRDRFDQFERFPPPAGGDFTIAPQPRNVPITEKNDCEIIVVAKSLTEYAEYIEGRLKRLGIVVDLLFPMEDVPIGKVLGNIASRGCLYAILVMPQNQEKRSLTLTILHGLPQEHRNMPLEDALQLLSRNFQEVQRGGSAGREAVYALLGQLADGRTLTVLQYDKVIEYLKERREHQVKMELGESPSTKTQDLQQRILSILNDKQIETAPAAPNQNKLLSDPTVKKALESILSKYT